jgi:putative transposase
MTTATMALTELAEKGADIEMLRQMVQFMAQRLMGLDVEGRCGAGYDEKSVERINSRNGYRERSWDTRAGSVSSSGSPSCARAATSLSSSSRGARPRRR